MLKRVLRKLMTGAISGITGCLFVWIVLNVGVLSDFFYRLEAVTYDWRLQKLIEPPPHTIEDIIIVDIDGRTLNNMGSFYQWSRTTWAKIIRILDEGDVRMIGLDVVFDRARRFPAEDREMIEAIRAHGNVFNAIVLTHADRENFMPPMSREPAGLEAERFRMAVPEEIAYDLEAFQRLEPDFVELLNAGEGIGGVNLSADRDGIFRRCPLFVRFNEHVYPTLAFSMAYQDIGGTGVQYDAGNREVVVENTTGDPLRIPVDDAGRMLIYYHGPYQTFRYISFFSLLHEMYPLRDESGILSFFRDKTVLIGSSAPGLFDLRATPRQPVFPGVEIHANILHQLRSRHFIRELSDGQRFLILLAAGLLAGLLFALMRPGRGALTAGSLAFLFFLTAWNAFSRWSLWLPMMAPMVTLLITYTIHYAYRYTVAEKDRRDVQRIFSHYVSPAVVNRLLQQPDQVKLGGEKRVCTVLFSDIENFTGLAERTPPEHLVPYLNEYLTAMTHVIFRHQGTLDKYEGDAIMTFYGAPVDNPAHALAACRTALEMLSELVRLNEAWERRALPQLRHRIGINTGPMIVGNLGSDIRFDYTAIGDAVNLGARLESANKLYGTKILISEDTYNSVRNEVVVRELDLVQVKGKQQPVRIYELIALKQDELSEETQEMLAHFAEGYRFYREKNWADAEDRFRQILQFRGDDGPARLFVLRCQEYRKKPPPANWNGVYSLKNTPGNS